MPNITVVVQIPDDFFSEIRSIFREEVAKVLGSPSGANDASPRVLFSIEDAAKQLGISPVTLRKMCREGRVKSVRIGDRRLISAGELQRVTAEGAK